MNMFARLARYEKLVKQTAPKSLVILRVKNVNMRLYNELLTVEIYRQVSYYLDNAYVFATYCFKLKTDVISKKCCISKITYSFNNWINI